MKKYFYMILALVASVAFTSCNKDKDGDATETNVEYMFSASFDLRATPSEEAEKAQADLVKKALLSAGFSADNLSMELVAPDSATASQMLLGKMAKVENEVKGNMTKGIININVKGAEKKYFNSENDKSHPISVWYSKELRNFVVTGSDPVIYGLRDIKHDYRWVKWMRTNTNSYFPSIYGDFGDYYVQFGRDANYNGGGDYIYLILEHSGKSKYEDYDHEFEWEDQFANTYITDVIAVYGGGEPQTLRIDGRTYKKQNQVCDLNRNASGAYIWLYATTDPMPGYEGYYLNTGKNNDGFEGVKTTYCCRTLSDGNNFVAKNHLNAPWVHKGHRIVERVVEAYDIKGVHQGELDTNKGHGGDFIRIILTYATKSAGY